MQRKFNRVYTAGAFDSLHIGHIRLLKAAKQNGNKLIVAVSTDELILDYKKKAPLQTLKDRIEIVSSIKYVDEVVIQTSRDYKLNDCLNNKCECMVVGSDWKGTNFFNKLQKEFESKGLKIIFHPYTKGISTTIIRLKSG